MKSSIKYETFFVCFIIFHKCKTAAFIMKLAKEYKHEAYIAGIGTLSIFNITKLNGSKDQTFVFSKQSAAGSLIGYQLKLPTTNRLSIKHFDDGVHRYLLNSVIHGPITVLMHEANGIMINRYLYIGTGTQQKFEVTVSVDNLKKTLLFIRLLGTSTKTKEYKFDKDISKFDVMNEADIGDLTGISIRIKQIAYDFPYLNNVSITHNGIVNTFVFDSNINGPATFVKLLDRYENECHWTTWTEITSKTNDVARQRTCFKYGAITENCDTCPGDSLQFVLNNNTGLCLDPNIQQNHTKIRGKNVSGGSFYVVIGVLAVSVLLNFATVAVAAVLYRRRNELRKQLQI